MEEPLNSNEIIAMKLLQMAFEFGTDPAWAAKVFVTLGLNKAAVSAIDKKFPGLRDELLKDKD